MIALEVSQVFVAPRARVFRAWTDPATLRRWYRLDDTWEVPVAEVDLRVGGAYRIDLQPPGRGVITEAGEYLEIVTDERLVYTCVRTGIGEPEHTIVTVEFRDTPGGSEVVVREEGFPSEVSRDTHAGGWPLFLARIDAALQEGSAS